MQRFVSKRSFSVFSDLTRAFWNAMTYGSTGSAPMKSLWKNKTELHDLARSHTVTNKQTPKSYVKDWNVTVKKVKNQNNQWRKLYTEEGRDASGRYGRRGGRRDSQWSRL